MTRVRRFNAHKDYLVSIVGVISDGHYDQGRDSECKVNNYYFLSHLLVAGCDIGIRFSTRPSVNIYVEVRHLCQS